MAHWPLANGEADSRHRWHEADLVENLRARTISPWQQSRHLLVPEKEISDGRWGHSTTSGAPHMLFNRPGGAPVCLPAAAEHVDASEQPKRDWSAPFSPTMAFHRF